MGRREKHDNRIKVLDLNIAVPYEPETEVPVSLESDVLRGDTYLGSAASEGVECEKKFFTDLK